MSSADADMVRAFKICREMLEWRGHEIVESIDLNDKSARRGTILARSARAIAETQAPESDFKMLVERHAPPPPNIECKFFFEPKLNIGILKSYLRAEHVQTYEQIVIVGRQILQCNILKTTRANSNVEIFTVAELQLNVMLHTYQPKFEKMTDPDFLASFDKSGKPVMLERDPVARFMRYRSGDVIRIGNSRTPDYYRVVRQV